MSDTPRTDAALYGVKGISLPYLRLFETCRALELELSAEYKEGFKLSSRVQKLAVESTCFEQELTKLRAAEKEISDAYLRVRTLLNAFETKEGGSDRFEVTEKAIDDMNKSKMRLLRERLVMLNALRRIIEDEGENRVHTLSEAQEIACEAIIQIPQNGGGS